MTALTADDALEQRRARNREAQRRWRERHGRPTTEREREQAAERQRRLRERRRSGEQAQPVERQALGTRENDFRDPGPAIAAGEPFVDDFDECEAKWTAAFGAERTASYTDEPAPRW